MSARHGIDRTHIFWALLCLSLALIPHAGRFSIWMLVCFGALAAWRVAGEYDLLPLPDRRHVALWVLKQLLAVAAFIAIYITYQGQLGRDAGIALLTALLGLKMLELHNERDYYVVMFLAYFLVVTNFFYSQTIATALFMLVIVITVTAGLVRFNATDPALGPRACMLLAARYVAEAVPLMIVGFFLFPRIPGPLWGLPQDSTTAVTGLSEEMTIGHITQLGVSDEIAFRIAFDGEPPPARDLYWRGPVMWHTDGRSWRAGDIGDGIARPVAAEGRIYRYTVTLEPHDRRWMFGIEAVTNVGDTARQTSDYRLLAQRPIKRRLRYTLESRVDFRRPGITPEERAAALALPPDAHPRTRQLAAGWRATTPSDDRLVTGALRYFNEQAFVYTLTPQRLGGDSIDEFLFRTRAGFCEHYAAAFVTLMRAAGIPARVVTGYQGGEFNAMSDYMIVRQRDAHAWAEVFLAERGWVRIDPTAAVAPERVSLGINEALPQQRFLPMLGANSAAGNAWRQIANTWDALNYNWSQWVLGYTPKRQRQLLDDAGLEDWDYGTLIIALTLGLTALMVALALFVLRQRSGNGDPAVIAYRQFCRKLSRVGFERQPWEGPRDFARRVCRERSDLAADVATITDTYAAIRYAGAKLSSTRLSAQVRDFKAG
ncbi:MAG: transglutaminase TgpA family protein [Gammaproteobacteria bacterium]|jgi:transglutaminase-like putative cysteine protease